MSDATVARTIDGVLITLKTAGKDSDVPVARNIPRVVNARIEYAQFYMDNGANDHVIYIDESGYNVFTRRTQGRAPIAERVRREVVPRCRNMVATLAISSDIGVIHNWLVAGTTTRETF